MKHRVIPFFLILALILTGCGAGNSVSTSSATPKAQSKEEQQIQAVKDIAWPYYTKSLDVTADSPEGRDYTDHKSAHAQMVYEKSLEAGEAIRQAVENNNLGKNTKKGHVPFSADIDQTTLAGAALCHDIGMSGSGYAATPILDGDGNPVKDKNGHVEYEKDEQNNYIMHSEDNDYFSEIRSNHSLNSGLYVLVNREGLRDAGYSDEQIDKMAIECMAHSKSNSGVLNLNSAKDWYSGFDRMDSLVLVWNQDHPDETISFDRKPFEQDLGKLGSLAAESLALRVGDVSRDSGPEAEAQSGETVYVDRDTIDDHGDTIAKEIGKASITIGEKRDPVESEKSRQVHAGEQNIRENHTVVNDKGVVTHQITVIDGCSAPRCTQQAVDDHLGEFYSARDERFDVEILFDRFEAKDKDFFQDSWEDFRIQAAQDYPSITIHFPWDKDGAK